MNQHKIVCTVLSICKGNRKLSRGEKEQQRAAGEEKPEHDQTLTSLSTRLSSNRSVTVASEPVDIPARSTCLEDVDASHQEEVRHYNAKTWGLYQRIAAQRRKKNTSHRACFSKRNKDHKPCAVCLQTDEKASERDGVFDLDM
jgi:hypothetical protein